MEILKEMAIMMFNTKTKQEFINKYFLAMPYNKDWTFLDIKKLQLHINYNFSKDIFTLENIEDIDKHETITFELAQKLAKELGGE